MEQFRCNQMVLQYVKHAILCVAYAIMCRAEVIYNTRSHTFAINLHRLSKFVNLHSNWH